MLAIAGDGTGSLLLGGSNTYSGGTQISGGILSINNDVALAPPVAR